MFGLSHLNRSHRLGLGIIILLIVDIIWVVSSELTEYIFKHEDYDKPFFTTYTKTVMFASYLIGFVFWRPWRIQCCHKKKYTQIAPTEESIPIANAVDPNSMLGSPIYVPVKYADYESRNSGGESDDASSINGASIRSVRFSNLSEVRQLSEEYAVEHKMARLSYQASVEVEEKMTAFENKLPIKQVIKLAFMFSVLYFFAHYTYQEALSQTESAIVNAMSSTSGLFTLICSAIVPSSSGDKFTLSKLSAVLTSLGGIVLVCFSESKMEHAVPAGSLWALFSALLYSLYLVLVKKKVSDEDKMDIPMFFGPALSSVLRIENTKTTNAERCKAYRQRIKNDPKLYLETRQKDAQRCKDNRKKPLSEEELARTRALAAKRARVYRAKKKANKDDLTKKESNKTPQAKTRKAKEEQRQKWREEKAKQRSQWSGQKKRWHRQKSLAYYYSKKGFVGLICGLLMWPGFFILDVSHEEKFQWPTRMQLVYILINGAIGTVLSEFLWLWGCFLTSSLIGTLALGLVLPLTMLADAVVKKVQYSIWFYLGTLPVFLSFFMVALLTHWESWDPVLLIIKKFIHFICRRRPLIRVRELDREQTTSLISEERPSQE